MTPTEKARQIITRLKKLGYTDVMEIKRLALMIANEVTEQAEQVATYEPAPSIRGIPNLDFWYAVIYFLNEYDPEPDPEMAKLQKAYYDGVRDALKGYGTFNKEKYK